MNYQTKQIMKTEDFYTEFRKEHRIIRDLLLGLITALLQQDNNKAGTLLKELDTITGPHFRYEEETLYPGLVHIFGEPYINKLLTDHDLAITRAKKLKTIIEKEKQAEGDYLEGINLVRAILPHVSDCEGLTIMVEKLPKEKVDAIINSMINSREQNIPLLRWSEKLRGRKLLSITN